MTSSPRDSSVGAWRHLLPARPAQLADTWSRGRLGIVIGVSLLAAVVAALSHLDTNSDFAQLNQAAEVWWRGGDPYSVRAGPFPVFYPFTAVVLALPFSFLPFPDAWFVGMGTAIFLWAITSRAEFRYAWFALLAPAFITTVRLSQWPGLMIGGALLPVWGFVLACKPTIGAALWLAFPSKRALVGSVVLLVLSIALLPTWPERWLGLLSEGVHFKPPVMFWGGPVDPSGSSPLASMGCSAARGTCLRSADALSLRNPAVVPDSSTIRARVATPLELRGRGFDRAVGNRADARMEQPSSILGGTGGNGSMDRIAVVLTLSVDGDDTTRTAGTALTDERCRLICRGFVAHESPLGSRVDEVEVLQPEPAPQGIGA